jgi:cytochrome c
MSGRTVFLVAIASAVLALGAGAAGERGTPDEAKTMLKKAVAHYKAVGRKQALADFNAKKPPFGDRDLYVFCIGPDRIEVANGGFPSYVGMSADAIKDAKGSAVGKAILDTASSKGEGSVEYLWLNPVSHKTEAKISFVEKVGDDVCGVGAYNPGK